MKKQLIDPIQIWRFHDAPEEYSRYFDNDDADWLALVPKELAKEEIRWLEEGTPFGCCAVSNQWLPDGRLIQVGYHA